MNELDLTIELFNELKYDQAIDEMQRCCGAKKWCEAIVDSRPFQTRKAFDEAVYQAFSELREKDWLEAFSQHPKVGDIKSLRMKFAGNREWSAAEQSGVAKASESTIAALAAGNLAYEKKFGFIFIVCATGKSANEILAILKSRLLHDQRTEIRNAAIEQQKITHLRIDKWTIAT